MACQLSRVLSSQRVRRPSRSYPHISSASARLVAWHLLRPPSRRRLEDQYLILMPKSPVIAECFTGIALKRGRFARIEKVADDPYFNGLHFTDKLVYSQV